MLVFICVLAHCPAATAQAGPPSQNSSVQVAMKNVIERFSDQISVHIVRLQGEFVPQLEGLPVTFDDKNSFLIEIASAEVAIPCDSLANLLNQSVFSKPAAPIKDVKLEIKDGRIITQGRLRKGDIPFESSATISLNGDGRIRLHAEGIKAAHLPVKGLMDALGVELAEVVNTNKIPGMAVEKDDFLLDPELIFPPPRIHGKLSSIRLQGNEVVQVFGGPPAPSFASGQRGNYMAYRGGTLRFGKLTMANADMILIDMDPNDPFDFYLDHYKDQLMAGYSKTTAALGLRVYARDYDKLHTAPGRSEKQPVAIPGR